MNDQVYWIWLSMALGAGARTDEILSAFPQPQRLYEADRAARMLAGVFTGAQLNRLERTPLQDAETAVNICRRNGWRISTPADPTYPAMLRTLIDQPLVLFCDGDPDVLNDCVAVGVVGTRKPTAESVRIARMLSADLAAAGAVIVSGGALGIDSAAHTGALLSGGKTVCVMGCGLGTDYLRENEPLRRDIRTSGAVISEYPPFAPASRSSFPIRNRLISGLSSGVLVIEAGEKSGSLITARFANEQGREVFAIPGSILNSAYTGANRLIRDGAKVVTCAQDVLEPFAAQYPGRLDLSAIGRRRQAPAEPAKRTASAAAAPAQQKKAKKVPASPLDPDAARVYNLFENAPLHPDEISAATGLPPARLIPVLLQLSLADLITQTEGGCYIIAG